MALDDLKSEIAAAAKGASHDRISLKSEDGRLLVLPLSVIEQDATQPRKDLGDLEEMAASILEHGILQPIVVCPVPGGSYQVVVGERRFAASRLAGLKSIPCIVRTVEEHKKLELQIIENVHRKAFTAVEEARAYQRLLDEHRYRHEDLARVLGKSRTTITQTLAILRLPEEALLKAEANPHVTSSLLLEVSKEEGDLQKKMLNAALTGEASVRSLRAMKAAAARAEGPKPPVVAFAAGEGTVTVRLPEDSCTWRSAIQALREALRQAEQELQEGLEKQFGESSTVVGRGQDAAIPFDRRGSQPKPPFSV